MYRFLPYSEPLLPGRAAQLPNPAGLLRKAVQLVTGAPQAAADRGDRPPLPRRDGGQALPLGIVQPDQLLLPGGEDPAAAVPQQLPQQFPLALGAAVLLGDEKIPARPRWCCARRACAGAGET